MTDTRTRWATPLFAVLAFAAVVLILYTGRNLTFYFDEWNFILDRRGFTVENLIAGHNGHLSLFPVLFYKALLQVIGLDHYWIYQLALALVHATAAWLLFTLARRRLGDAAGLAAGVLLLVLGAAFDDLVWAFQIGFVGAVAASLASLNALDANTKRGDVWAAIWLAVALCCSSPAIPFAILIAVELLLGRDMKRVLRVLAVPLVLYGIWTLVWGSGGPWPAPQVGTSSPARIPDFFEYALRMMQTALQGLTGFTQSGLGPTLSVLFAAVVVIAAVRRPPTPRAWGAIVGAVIFWLLIAASRYQLNEPYSTRYIYPSAVLILILSVELLAPVRERLVSPSTRELTASAVVVTVFAVGGLGALIRGSNSWEPQHRAIEIGLAAMTIAREHAPPGFQPAASASPQITAARYFAAADDFGTRVLSPAEIAASPKTDRAAADVILQSLEFGGVSPAPGRGRGCAVAAGDIKVPVDGVLVLRIPAGETGQLRLKRFADAYPTDAVAQLPAGLTAVTVKQDRVGRPWLVSVKGAPGVARCRG